MVEEIIQQVLAFLSTLFEQGVGLAFSLFEQGVGLITFLILKLEEILAPIDPVIFIFSSFIIGVVIGLVLGKKKAFKSFFKMPSAHWRIRRKK
jgi:hypothetical protein